MKVKKFNVAEEGINHFFGPLEARIMDIIWSSEGLSIKEVQKMLNEENPLSFNTIMTVMNRLLEKGHLKKYTKGKGRGQTSCYVAVQSKEEFLMEQMQAVTYGLIREYGEMVVTHMIDALDHVDPKLITKLQEKINGLKSREMP